MTFPLPSLAGKTQNQVHEVVRRLVDRLKAVEENREDKVRRERYERTKRNIAHQCDSKYGNAQALVPTTIPALAVRADDRGRLLKACLDKLVSVPSIGGALTAVRELVDFSALLAMRENQLVVPSGRMIAKEVPAAKGAEMRHEMQRELQGLDPFVAHVSTIVKAGGEARPIKVKLRTPDKPEQKDPDVERHRWNVVEANTRKYYTEHQDIEREIERRRGAGGDREKHPGLLEPPIIVKSSVPPSRIVKEPGS